MKSFTRFLPVTDHLYIFQLFEYETLDFLEWFLKNPLKRNLQRKHSLDFTPKVVMLLSISLVLITGLSILTAVFITSSVFTVFLSLLLFFILSQISPLFIITSQLILWPLENYRKQKVITAAKNKMQRLKNIRVVAIVGSFAKTSTKNMLYTLLWKDFRVVKTPKSFNTEIAIARTILSDLKDDTEIFIVEMDAYHPGEIKKLAELVNPDFGILTAIAPQHLERFGTMEQLARSQFEIASALKKSGTLFLNSTDQWTRELHHQYEIKKVFFGLSDKDDTEITGLKQTASGIEFLLRINHGIKKITLPIFGTHNAVNFAASAAVAFKLGVKMETIQKRGLKILPTPHRLEVRKSGHLTLIDNTYNTNPTVTNSSLKLLKDLPGPQKIIITPGLIELGKESDELNKQFAKALAKIADIVVIVGENSKQALRHGLAEVAYPSEKTHFVHSTQAGLNLIYKIAPKDAVLLIENDLPDQYF